jgi:alpha/beta superfamily hydrolase
VRSFRSGLASWSKASKRSGAWKAQRHPDTKNSLRGFHFGSRIEQEMCQRCNKQCSNEPMIIPPTASKSGLHRELRTVWRRAAKRLAEADSIFVIGYSWPEGDHFFHQLYALGTVGETILSRFWVCNPNKQVRDKFRDELLGQQAKDCFGPPGDDAYYFHQAVARISNEFKTW